MCDVDAYMSIGSPGQGVFRDKGSRFIALAYPVGCEAEVKSIVDSLKREYHGARHHCYAYRIGPEGERWRANDDGEPSGSAARQILSQIDSEGLSDILVVVVRYFGGIKLGIPGLIRAYRASTAEALAAAPRATHTAGSWWRLSFGYDNLPAVMKNVKDMALEQRAQDFGTECSMEVRVKRSQTEDFFARMKKISTFNELF